MKRKYLALVFIIAILLLSTIAAAGFWQDVTGMFSLTNLFKEKTKAQPLPPPQTEKSAAKPSSLVLGDIPFFDTPLPKTGPAKLDLTAQNIIFTEKELISNIELDAKIAITNVGRAAVTTKIPYSLGDSPKDVKFLSKSSITISPGQTIELPFTWQFPIEQPSLDTQEKAIYLILDPLNAISEENENNNGFYKIFDVYSIIQGPKEQTKEYPALKDKSEYFISSKKDFCIELNKNSICNKKAGNDFKLSIDKIEAKTNSNRISNIFKKITTNAIALFKKSSSSSKQSEDANLEIKETGIKLIFSSVVSDYVPIHTGINCDYATADELLMACPSREDMRQIRNDFNIYFDSPPAPWSCTNNGYEYSTTLSIYNALRIMKCTSFDENFPWNPEHNNLYQWLKDVNVEGIEIFSCPDRLCNSHYDGVIHLVSLTSNGPSLISDQLSRTASGTTRTAVLLSHEAQHEYLGHTCLGGNDHNLDEMGAWAVQYYLLNMLSQNTGNYFTEEERQEFESIAVFVYSNVFCDYSRTLNYSDSCGRNPENDVCKANTVCEAWSAGNYRCSCLADSVCPYGRTCFERRCEIPTGGECDTRRADLCITGHCTLTAGQRFKGTCTV